MPNRPLKDQVPKVSVQIWNRDTTSSNSERFNKMLIDPADPSQGYREICAVSRRTRFVGLGISSGIGREDGLP